MMWTRWGQARPLVKCVALSLFAHLLLVLFMGGTRVLSMLPPGESLAGTVQVRLIEDAGDEDLAPAPAEPDESASEKSDKPLEITAPPLLPAPMPEPTPP